MAIPSSGSLALSAIQTEFGGSNPISMSEYYAGGSNVPSGTTGNNGNVPTSGALDFNDFRGSSNVTFMIATGGTITTSGDYKIHRFTSSGTFAISQRDGASPVMDYLIIAGGGGGGAGSSGGAGAGGRRYVTGFTQPSTGNYSVTVGAGGTVNMAPNYGTGNNGGNSVWNGITSTGGGGGGGQDNAAGSGGSGGGSQNANAGTGISGQGNNGARFDGGNNEGGGGGGAGAAGSTRNGGAGLASSITGSSVSLAGGGAGRFGNSGGSGGGAPSTNGGANTGGGGGGWTGNGSAGLGGSGVVILRYKFQ